MSAKVLIVDDEAGTRKLLRMMLEHAGFTIQEAENGNDCLKKVAANPPDVIILDVMMPDLDGMTVTRTLRADPATAELPIILLSARSHDAARREGMAAGANRYVAKPIGMKLLIDTVQEILAYNPA